VPSSQYLSRRWVWLALAPLVAAADLGRYRPLVRSLGTVFAVMSVVGLGVGLAAAMPWRWPLPRDQGDSCSGR